MISSKKMMTNKCMTKKKLAGKITFCDSMKQFSLNHMKNEKIKSSSENKTLGEESGIMDKAKKDVTKKQKK